jgi:hypothetical protein
VEGGQIDGFGVQEVGAGLCCGVEHDAVDCWVGLEGT